MDYPSTCEGGFALYFIVYGENSTNFLFLSDYAFMILFIYCSLIKSLPWIVHYQYRHHLSIASALLAYYLVSMPVTLPKVPQSLLKKMNTTDG